jgi:hypothetical protein
MSQLSAWLLHGALVDPYGEFVFAPATPPGEEREVRGGD